MASIADILIAQGQAVGRGIANRGQIIGGAISDLGSIPEQLTQMARQREQMQRQRDQDQLARQREARQEADSAQEREIRGLSLTEARKKADGMALLQRIEGEAFSGDDFDADKAAQKLTAAGRPDLIPTVRQHATDWAQNRVEFEDLKSKLLEREASKLDPSDLGSVQAWVASATKRGLLPRDDGALMLAQSVENPQAVVSRFMPKTAPKITEHDPAKELRDERGRLIVPATARESTPAEAETARHNRESERISAMGAGRAEASQAEAARHNRAMEESARNRVTARPVTAGNAEELADFDTSLDDLKVLRGAIAAKGDTGTASKIGAMLPNAVTDITGWGTDAKQKQALIDRVKQVIGKTLEGGVLRKEDELKYEKILPTIGDTTAVVTAKLDGLDAAIAKRKARRLDAMEDAGYNVSDYRARGAKSAAPAAPLKIGAFTVVVKP